MKMLSWIFALSFLSLAACSTFKLEKDQANAVKRVAIVGFDVQQQRPVEGGDVFKALTHQSTASQAEVKGRMESAHVAMMYDNFRKKLETENHWQVMPQDTLKKNKAYQAYFKSKTEGFQNRPIINDRFNLMQPEGILDSFAVMTTEPEKRKQLQQDLGVDAIIYVDTTVNLNNSGLLMSMAGQGKMAPTAVTNVTMIDAKTDTKIWFDGKAEGEPVNNEERTFLGMAEATKVNQMAVLAADSSFKVLLAKYKKELGQ